MILVFMITPWLQEYRIKIKRMSRSCSRAGKRAYSVSDGAGRHVQSASRDVRRCLYYSRSGEDKWE